MAQVNAGRVRFVSQGEYNNNTQYYPLDFVTYEGSSYFAKSNTQGNLPTNTTYWQLIAEKGNTGETGNTGPTGNGIANTTKTSSVGLVDTYTITYTDGTTTTFEVTNGEDGEVTQAQLDEVQNQVDYYKTILNALPKVNGTGTSITLDNTAEAPMELELNPSEIEQRNIPIEYTQVEYIESSGTQYIDLGFKANQDTRAIIKAKALLEGQDYSTGYRLFGARTRVQNKAFWITTSNYQTADGSIYISYGNSASNLSVLDGNIHIYDFNKKDFYIDNVLVHSFGTQTFTTEYNALLFGGNDGGTIEAKSWKIYYCRVYDNGVLIRDLIPCYRNSDNEVGMYDIVNDVFYTNSGTGTFAYGSVASIPNPDYPQTIHTITGNNTITISNDDNTKSQTFPLTLGNLEYCKIGTYADEFIKATNEVGLTSGKWYLKKNVKKLIFNGTEDWGVQSTGTSNWAYRLTGNLGIEAISSTSLGYINLYEAKTISSSNTDNGFFCSKSNAWILIRYGTEDTVENYKTFLSNNNLIVYGRKTTPEYILLDSTLQTQLENIYNYALGYQDQTNISQINDDLPFIMDASAVRDMSNIYNEIGGE